MFLSNFRFAAPKHRSPQADLLKKLSAFAAKLPHIGPDKAAAFIERFGVKPPNLEHRYHEPQDYSDPIFAPATDSMGLKRKMDLFSARSSEALATLLPNPQSAPDLLIHVTCTGYVSPSPIQKMIAERNWSTTQHQHLYHMGCYAALPAVRTAHGELLRLKQRQESPRVEVFHSELCSLHLNLSEFSPEQIVIQTLFGDGYIGYSVTSKKPQAGLEILAIDEMIAPGTQDQMQWSVEEPSFGMALSRKVPDSIAPLLPQFRARLIEKSISSIDLSQMLYAIHPGGPKIIDRVAEAWNLEASQVEVSRKILREHGNMSSATLPTIWKALTEDSSVPAGTPVLSVGFGPGLTIFGALFRKVGA